jgi:hypothetical protein
VIFGVVTAIDAEEENIADFCGCAGYLIATLNCIS